MKFTAYLETIIVFLYLKGINGKLLKRLSDEDISIIFDPQKMTVVNQTHNTWYKSGVLVDLACNQASNVLHQVKIIIFNYTR